MEQNKFYQIKNVTEHEYTLVSCDGSVITRQIRDIDKTATSFTIQDAKDGDVLVCPLPKGYEEQIFIFKGINSRDYVENCIEYYCRVCEGEFYENKTGYMGTTSSPVYPATKEQRDLLFQKMKEAGYEWDAENKELKKIDARENLTLDGDLMQADCMIVEQKSSWTKEDDARLQACIDALQADSIYGKVDTVMTKWLKSLKQRIGG